LDDARHGMTVCFIRQRKGIYVQTRGISMVCELITAEIVNRSLFPVGFWIFNCDFLCDLFEFSRSHVAQFSLLPFIDSIRHHCRFSWL
jgi:hypothetical protein